jgi:lipid-binding SYLF domain-containing protein
MASLRLLTGMGVLSLSLALFAGCANQEVSEPDVATIEEKARAALATIEEKSPGFMDRLEAAPGYVVIGMAETKVPGVGTGLGYGLIVDNLRGEHSYIRITQLEVGAGLGAKRSKIIVVFDDEALLRRMIKGGLRFESSADITVVEGDSEASKTLTRKEGKGYEVYRLTESGAVATVTVRVLRGKPYVPAER